MKIRFWLVVGVCCLEISLLCTHYFSGKYGQKELQCRIEENEQLQKKMKCVTKEIKLLAENIAQWDDDSFAKEKIAREELQMARPHELIFFTNLEGN